MVGQLNFSPALWELKAGGKVLYVEEEDRAYLKINGDQLIEIYEAPNVISLWNSAPADIMTEEWIKV